MMRSVNGDVAIDLLRLRTIRTNSGAAPNAGKHALRRFFLWLWLAGCVPAARGGMDADVRVWFTGLSSAHVVCTVTSDASVNHQVQLYVRSPSGVIRVLAEDTGLAVSIAATVHDQNLEHGFHAYGLRTRTQQDEGWSDWWGYNGLYDTGAMIDGVNVRGVLCFDEQFADTDVIFWHNVRVPSGMTLTIHNGSINRNDKGFKVDGQLILNQTTRIASMLSCGACCRTCCRSPWTKYVSGATRCVSRRRRTPLLPASAC